MGQLPKFTNTYDAAVFKHDWLLNQGLITRVRCELNRATREPVWFAEYIHPARGKWIVAV